MHKITDDTMEETFFHPIDSSAPAADEKDTRVNRDEDRPFQPCLILTESVSCRALHLPAGRSDVEAAIRGLVANLIELVRTGEGPWLFYSRDNNHYSGMRRYVPKFFRRNVVVDAVDRLLDAGLIIEERTRPSPSARRRSRIRPSSALIEAIGKLEGTATQFRPREVIVLRGKDGRPLPYDDTALTCAWRRDVHEHNDFLNRFGITLRHPQVHIDPAQMLIVAGRRLNPVRASYYRVSNRRFGLGGRWYGPWWQQVPSSIRPALLIDGATTTECDIKACHMQLLCACAGIDIQTEDPYELVDFARTEVKLAINIMLNAPSWASARAALCDELRDRHGAVVGARADSIRSAVSSGYPALERYWNTGYGLRLQNIDATICMRVQQHLRRRNIPCLSIHDSFIVPTSAQSCTIEVMDQELQRACRKLRKADHNVQVSDSIAITV